MTPETAPAMETYARLKAWADFLKEVAFSLQVWHLDPDVRRGCAPIAAWLTSCRDDLDHIIPQMEGKTAKPTSLLLQDALDFGEPA